MIVSTLCELEEGSLDLSRNLAPKQAFDKKLCWEPIDSLIEVELMTLHIQFSTWYGTWISKGVWMKTKMQPTVLEIQNRKLLDSREVDD